MTRLLFTSLLLVTTQASAKNIPETLSCTISMQAHTDNEGRKITKPILDLGGKPVTEKLTLTRLTKKSPSLMGEGRLFPNVAASFDILQKAGNKLWLVSTANNIQIVQLYFDEKEKRVFTYKLWEREFATPTAPDYIYEGNCL